MKLHITYLKGALEKAKADRSKVEKEKDYYVHFAIRDLTNIIWREERTR